MLLLPTFYSQSRNFGEMRLTSLSLEGIGLPSIMLKTRNSSAYVQATSYLIHTESFIAAAMRILLTDLYLQGT